MHTLTNTCTPLWSNTGLAWGLTVKRNWGHWMLPKDQESVPEPESSPHPLIKYTCWTRPSGVQPPSTPSLPADRIQFYSGDSIFNSQRWKLVQPKPFHGCRISLCRRRCGYSMRPHSGQWDVRGTLWVLLEVISFLVKGDDSMRKSACAHNPSFML